MGLTAPKKSSSSWKIWVAENFANGIGRSDAVFAVSGGRDGKYGDLKRCAVEKIYEKFKIRVASAMLVC